MIAVDKLWNGSRVIHTGLSLKAGMGNVRMGMGNGERGTGNL